MTVHNRMGQSAADERDLGFAPMTLLVLLHLYPDHHGRDQNRGHVLYRQESLVRVEFSQLAPPDHQSSHGDSLDEREVYIHPRLLHHHS